MEELFLPKTLSNLELHTQVHHSRQSAGYCTKSIRPTKPQITDRVNLSAYSKEKTSKKGREVTTALLQQRLNMRNYNKILYQVCMSTLRDMHQQERTK